MGTYFRFSLLSLVALTCMWGCSTGDDDNANNNDTIDSSTSSIEDSSTSDTVDTKTTRGDPGPSEDTGAAPDVNISTVEISIGPIPDGLYDPFNAYFSKYVNIFGVNIFASADTPDEKVLHAARVMAQYLDNDEDGVPDNPEVVAAMTGQPGGASLVMFNHFNDLENSGIFKSDIPENFPAQDLMGVETHPEGSSAQGGFDATLEEVLHLITSKGYAQAYPDIFGEESGTAIADAMDLARGGKFFSIPNRYPQSAWYHYDDFTCDYGCMITEYFYWALTSLLGGQNYSGRCAEISVEWEACSPELVQEQDPTIYTLLTDPKYKLPSVLPDGDYQ